MNDIHRKESGSAVTILHSLKALETRRQWPNRLKVVFTSPDFTDDLNEQIRYFMAFYGGRYDSSL